jgi:hypothetical protein
VENSDAIATDTSSPAAVITAVVEAAAAALASLTVKRVPAKSKAAEAISSGAAMTNGISHLPPSRGSRPSNRRAVECYG